MARSVAALRKTPNRVLGYVENMKGYYCEGCDDVKPLFPDSDEVDLGQSPASAACRSTRNSPLACDRGDGRNGLSADRPSIRALSEMAARIADALESTS